MSEHEVPGQRSSGVFEKVAAKAKKTVGRLMGNQDLTEEGELQEAKAETAEDATRLTTEAEQRQREADVAAEQEANRIEQERVQADLARAEREEQIERDRKVEEARVDNESARRRAAVNDQARHDDEMIEHGEQATVAARIDGALEATAISQEAKQAEAAAEALDAAQRELERQQTGE